MTDLDPVIYRALTSYSTFHYLLSNSSDVPCGIPLPHTLNNFLKIESTLVPQVFPFGHFFVGHLPNPLVWFLTALKGFACLIV
jgi:hypothetical protein